MSDKRRFTVEVELRQPDVPTTDYALAGTLEDVFRQYKDITDKCNHIASVRYIIEHPQAGVKAGDVTMQNVRDTLVDVKNDATEVLIRVEGLIQMLPHVP